MVLSGVLQAVVQAFGVPVGGWLNLGPCYSCQFRKQLRDKYNIHNGAGSECLYHYFCQPCSLCQEHVELHKRLTAGNLHMQHGQPGVAVMIGHMNAGPTTMGQPVMGQPMTGQQQPGQQGGGTAGNPYYPTASYVQQPNNTQQPPPPPYQTHQATVTQPPVVASM